MIQSSKNKDPIVSTLKQKDPDQFDITLRPHILDEYVGQKEIKRNLKIFMQAAKKRKEPLEHALLYGAPGLGKTTLAYIIAREMGVNIKTTTGPAMEKQGDVAAIITNLQENDILFIDEIHRLKPVIEEVLYSAMEDFRLDIIIGKGPSARTMKLSLPKFTLIGATTKASMLSSPLRDRFGHIFKLNFYSVSDIAQIIHRSARILNYKIEEGAAIKLARCSRRTPRIANRLLRRTRDFADVASLESINEKVVEETLRSLEIDELGLDRSDRDMLALLIDKFKGGPVGLNTISAALSEEEGTIEDIHEPYLMQLGFLERTARGRLVTERAYEHLGKRMVEKDAESQKKLF